MGKVPRHEYVPVERRPYAYADSPLPIGFGKSISLPFIIAIMTDLLDVRPSDSMLEIGTGLGYQATILAELPQRGLQRRADRAVGRAGSKALVQEKHANVQVMIGNGCHGWPEHAPFDKIIVTAAPELTPPR